MMKARNKAQRLQAFTLIELLVVIAIIGILIGLLLPAVQKVREAANRMSCSNNLKQLALACNNYDNTYGVLPPSRIARDAYLTWPVLVMPFIEQDNLFKRFEPTLGQGWTLQPTDAQQAQVKTFFCPSRRSPPQVSPMTDIPPGSVPYAGKMPPGACGDYACCAGDGFARNTFKANGAMISGRVLDKYIPKQTGDNGVDQPNANPPAFPLIPIQQFSSYTSVARIPDGTSNTFLLGEKHVQANHFGQYLFGDGAYYQGYSYDTAQRTAGNHSVVDPASRLPSYPLATNPNYCWGSKCNSSRDIFGGAHPGVCLFVFVDGHVSAISTNIDLVNLTRLAVRDDGQVPSFDQ